MTVANEEAIREAARYELTVMYTLPEEEKRALVADLQAATALSRLSYDEIIAVFAEMEARDYWLVNPKVIRPITGNV
jgi:hypothetical protein